jgi:hypothetical protein
MIEIIDNNQEIVNNIREPKAKKLYHPIYLIENLGDDLDQC